MSDLAIANAFIMLVFKIIQVKSCFGHIISLVITRYIILTINMIHIR